MEGLSFFLFCFLVCVYDLDDIELGRRGFVGIVSSLLLSGILSIRYCPGSNAWLFALVFSFEIE